MINSNTCTANVTHKLHMKNSNLKKTILLFWACRARNGNNTDVQCSGSATDLRLTDLRRTRQPVTQCPPKKTTPASGEVKTARRRPGFHARLHASTGTTVPRVMVGVKFHATAVGWNTTPTHSLGLPRSILAYFRSKDPTMCRQGLFTIEHALSQWQDNWLLW